MVFSLSRFGGVLVAACSIALASGACSDEPQPFQAGDDPIDPKDDDDDEEEEERDPNAGAEMFAALEADLVGSCGAGCHSEGGIANTPFLASPDVYKSITSWPGIIVTDWESSLLLTHPVAGSGHTGTNLDSGDLATTLLPRVQDWLEEEAKGIIEQETSVLSTPVFAPIIGFNAVYLGDVDEAFVGMALTFQAEEVSATTLKLTDMQIHTTAAMGVHLVHPLFSVHPVGLDPDPDPADSFSNIDTYYLPGEAAPLGPGLVLFTNWEDGAKLSIAFAELDLYDGGGMTGGGCLDLVAFEDNAAGPLSANCTTCHGNAGSQAAAAVDMTALGSDPAATCAQIKNRVNLEDPPSSQLFITTDPGGNAAHPYKFNGNGGAFNSFRDALTIWIDAEATAEAMPSN